MEHTIFKSYGMMTLEEIAEEEKGVKEFLSEEYPEIEQTEESITQEIYDRIDLCFNAEISNLDKQLDGRILAIASIGRWNGRVSGYKILNNNLNEVVKASIGCDEKHVYCDRYNVLADGYHHDGRNYVEFREIREDKDIDVLLNKLYNNEPVSRADIRKYTKSLRPKVKEVYGF